MSTRLTGGKTIDTEFQNSNYNQNKNRPAKIILP